MKNVSLTAPLIDIVEQYRISQHRNLWTDLLYLDLMWIILEWD